VTVLEFIEEVDQKEEELIVREDFGKSLLVSLFFFIFEAFAIWFLWDRVISWPVFFLIHLLIMGTGYLLIRYFSKKEWDLRFVILAMILVGSMGVFGAGLAALALILYRFYVMVTEPISNLIASIMPRLKIPLRQKIYERIIYGMEETSDTAYAVPFNDVMTYGTDEQKMVAIDKMLRFFSPEFIPSFKLAADDDNNAVRVLAATAISYLEESYHDKYLELKKEVEEDMTNAPLVFRYARHCEEYANSEFYDESRIIKMREEAALAYEHYLTLLKDDHEVRFHLAELFMELGEIEKAKELLVILASDDETHTRKVYMRLMEVFFLLGNYGAMRQLTKVHFDHLLNLVDVDDPMDFEEKVFTWSGVEDMKKLSERIYG